MYFRVIVAENTPVDVRFDSTVDFKRQFTQLKQTWQVEVVHNLVENENNGVVNTQQQCMWRINGKFQF